MTSPVLEQLQRRKTGAPSLRKVEEAAAVLVGAYGRISDDQEDEETGDRGAGVRRQQRANDHIAQARGWKIKQRYEDNDLSAFKESVVRPAFEQMLEDLEAGVIAGIICYNLDRFARRPNDLERAIGIYDRAKKAGRQLYFATAEGDLNLASDDGLTMARVMVAFANKASRDTARRVAFKHQEHRDAGRPVGGTRPFGWNWTVDASGHRAHVLNKVEAAAIHQAALDLTARTVGWHALAERWNEAGLLSSRGNPWVKQTIKQVMLSPRLAGWMTHKGAIAEHSQTGEFIRGQWQPILTDEEYEALMVAVASAPQGTTPQGAGKRKYLLSGIVRCGTCDHLMSGNRRTDVHFYYACRKSSRGCGSMSISGFELDRLISKLMIARLEQADIRGETVVDERPHVARLQEISDRRRGLLKEVGEETLTLAEATPLLTKLQAEADQLHAEQMEWLRTRGARTARVTAEAWLANELTLAERQAFVAAELETVYVNRSTRPAGSRTFDPYRVRPVWRR